jgi:hypothetical protein
VIVFAVSLDDAHLSLRYCMLCSYGDHWSLCRFDMSTR